MSISVKDKKTQARVQANVDADVKDMADLQLQNAVKKLPVKKLRTKKEIDDFFNDED